eukprot:CAMPEP_0204211888 /NCGR_PEP_ID=MMETSP0361-20130328/74822_1 /ASSEMBLY_ACC=CAM_ASM_000343 /TAXON_ID=268821 /ORGANISM="Scrippsiella Hangoei, Strain SHTV-5" /LENGTH=194 /DNA_ID=CAMNT_0051176139 /DNA_START=141 /DNA_END=722 /DNA_ORIENTATION=+
MLAVLAVVNDATKWVVSGGVAAWLLWRHDEGACWCVCGAVVNAFNCKVLKVIINQTRPSGACRADPGMPSSHGCSLGFLSAYMALVLSAWVGTLASGGALVGGLFLSWLRIALGFHTWAQVAVGHTLGSLCATGWFLFGEAHALPLLRTSARLRIPLFGGTLVLCLAFMTHTLSDLFGIPLPLGLGRRRDRERE